MQTNYHPTRCGFSKHKCADNVPNTYPHSYNSPSASPHSHNVSALVSQPVSGFTCNYRVIIVFMLALLNGHTSLHTFLIALLSHTSQLGELRII